MSGPICRGGECGGECWKCRAKELCRERDEARALLVYYAQDNMARGTVGPWRDGWDDRNNAILDRAEDYSRELTRERGEGFYRTETDRVLSEVLADADRRAGPHSACTGTVCE